MILTRQLLISFGDIVLAGAAIDSQHFVIIHVLHKRNFLNISAENDPLKICRINSYIWNLPLRYFYTLIQSEVPDDLYAAVPKVNSSALTSTTIRSPDLISPPIICSESGLISSSCSTLLSGR